MGPTRPARSPRGTHRPVIRTLCAFSIVGLSLGAMTAGAGAPDVALASLVEAAAPAPASPVPASLVRTGTDAVITGSIDHIFATPGTFVGPNRMDKRDRARPVPDVVALAGEFAAARAEMIAMRTGPAPSVDGLQVAALTEVDEDERDVEDMLNISIAAVDPMRMSDALAAIDSIAGATDGPQMPVMASEQLAYARATTPATTDFGIIRDGVRVSDKELWCLAQAVYFEARGESYRGQVAVAQVVMNRVSHRLYPDTICGVVFQNQHWRNRCQFSFACDGIPEVTSDKRSWKQANDIAKGVVGGELYLTEVANATHYHATYVSPAWAPRLKRITKIGLHVFYTFKRG